MRSKGRCSILSVFDGGGEGGAYFSAHEIYERVGFFKVIYSTVEWTKGGKKESLDKEIDEQHLGRYL